MDIELWKPALQNHIFSEKRKYIRTIVMRFYKSIGELNNVWNEMYSTEDYSAFTSLDDVSKQNVVYGREKLNLILEKEIRNNYKSLNIYRLPDTQL